MHGTVEFLISTYYYKFTKESSSNFLKIGLDLTELWSGDCGPTFLAHLVQ